MKVQRHDARTARAPHAARGAVAAAATTLWIAGGALAVTASGLALWNLQRRNDWERTERSIDQLGPNDSTAKHLEDHNEQLARSINRVDDWSLALAVASGITLIGAGVLQIYKVSVVPGPEPRVALNLRW